jgi:hypothetical protein
MLAALDEKTRDAHIDEMVARKTRQQQQANLEASTGAAANANNGVMSNALDRTIIHHPKTTKAAAVLFTFTTTVP